MSIVAGLNSPIRSPTVTRNRLLLILGTLITIGGITASIVSSPASPNAQQSPPEISTQDADTTFTLKTEQNTVLVPVVVRNSKGEAIDDLRKEDFRVFDRESRRRSSVSRLRSHRLPPRRLQP